MEVFTLTLIQKCQNLNYTRFDTTDYGIHQNIACIRYRVLPLAIPINPDSKAVNHNSFFYNFKVSILKTITFVIF